MALEDEIVRLQRVASFASRAATLLIKWRALLNADGTPAVREMDAGDEDTAIQLTLQQVNAPRNAGVRELRKMKTEVALIGDY